MTTKKSFKNTGILITILVLSIITLVILNLYLAKKEELDQSNMYLYELEVESPLRVLLNYLGIRPAESVEWEEEEFREGLTSIIRDIEEGLQNTDVPILDGIPETTYTELKNMQEKIWTILGRLQNDKTLDDKVREEIMGLSKSIYTCKVDTYNESWEQINTELACLNETSDSKG
ncbi:hypothetical protein [Ornithinibacillus californiensis]|uniref:hypothetical protein n=1 Tax=Ornithinibacillus californiensis TaxID=161536 RepID=UPI00064D8369|nr:hypothetical protein [Ornithinibacillus californiensis]